MPLASAVTLKSETSFKLYAIPQYACVPNTRSPHLPGQPVRGNGQLDTCHHVRRHWKYGQSLHPAVQDALLSMMVDTPMMGKQEPAMCEKSGIDEEEGTAPLAVLNSVQPF